MNNLWGCVEDQSQDPTENGPLKMILRDQDNIIYKRYLGTGEILQWVENLSCM